jgi:hypothetical protein
LIGRSAFHQRVWMGWRLNVCLFCRQFTTRRTTHNASVPMLSAVSRRIRICADAYDNVNPEQKAT